MWLPVDGPLPVGWTGLSEKFPATMSHSEGAVADEEIEVHRPADCVRIAVGGSRHRGRGSLSQDGREPGHLLPLEEGLRRVDAV